MNLKKQLYWLWKYFSEKQLRNHYQKHYEEEIKYYENYKDKKNASLIRKEMNILKKYWGCYPYQYIRYGMYKNSCTLSVAQMKEYIPNYFAYYLFFPKIFKEYGVITEDKELTYRLLDSYNIKQPDLVLQFKNGVFYNKLKEVINSEQANELIQSRSTKKLFLKPTKGLGGKGIMVFNNDKNGFKDINNNVINAEFILKALGQNEDYILQEGLDQNYDLNKIYPNSINTVRIMTKIKKDKVDVMFSMLRMGQGGTQLDNASQKGLVCKIDTETGKFDNEAFTSLGGKTDQHPDTRFLFKGNSFPDWQEIKNFIISVAQKFETIEYMGWDVAYTVDGPAIIEMNAGAGLEYLQDCHGGVRSAYGIENPEQFWYSNQFAIKDL